MDNEKIIKTVQIYFIDFFTEYFKILIPPYQRPYTWGTQQVQDFLDDIFETITLDGNKKPTLRRQHFMGNVFVKDINDGRNNIGAELIDGQQRITTAYLLFVWFYKKMTDFDTTMGLNRREKAEYSEYLPYLFKLLFYDKDKIDPLKLSLGSINQEQLIDLTLNSNEGSHEVIIDEDDEDIEDARDTNEDSSENVAKYKTTTIIEKNFAEIDSYLERKISDITEEKKLGNVVTIVDEDSAVKIIYEIVLNAFKTTLIINKNIILGDDGRAYLMFESLNARGLPLSEIDKLKNKLFYIIFSTGDSLKYESAKKLWSKIISSLDNKAESFFRDFFLIEFKKSFSKKNLYSDLLKEIDKSTDKGNLAYNLILKAEKHSNYYKFILTNYVHLVPRLEEAENSGKNNIINIRQEVSYHSKYKILRPIILKALINYDAGKINENSLYKIVNLSSNLLVYFQLSQQSIGRFESSLPMIIRQSTNKNNDSLNYDLLKEKFHNYDESKYYLILSSLIKNESLTRERLLNLFDRDTNSILAYKLERRKSNQTTHVFKKRKFHIEHIWPLNYSNIPDWEEKHEQFLENDDNTVRVLNDLINSLGNLAVLDQFRNSKCKNKSFDEKKTIYKDKTDLQLINEVANLEDFDAYSIKKRNHELVNYIMDNNLLNL